ncbi:MAG TPA: ABC transporter permease, partial [Spirochaetales bacterium]|nr:ABC transporter permease [Spirochaetales bacterium]
MTDIKTESNWDLVIKPQDKLLNLKLRELIRYRDLVWLFIKRDFSTVYKQTILGPLWFIVNPLVSTIMYTFVFGKLAGIGTDGVPSLLFYYGGTMLWTYFSS